MSDGFVFKKWDKESLIDYVTMLINDNFDDEIECCIEYSENYLVIQ